MLRLMVRNNALASENRRFAQIGCMLVDYVRANMTPESMQMVQEGLVIGLLKTEWHLNKEKRREEQRRKRWTRLNWKGKQTTKAAHLSQLSRRVEILRERRNILLQCGDAVAWLLLGGDIRQLHAWFAEGRTHHLAREDHGLDGVMSIVKDAHASGKFLVVVTDTTRCLGIGDIIVAPADRPCIRPLVYEVKTHSTAVLNESDIELFSHRVNHAADEEFDQLFQQTLGFQDGSCRPVSKKTERQWAEIKTGFETLIEITRGATPNVPAPDHGCWASAPRVLERAEQTGLAFDCPEPGLVYAAWRPRPDNHNVIQDVVKQSFPPNCHTSSLSSADLREKNVYARAVLPLALLELPIAMRASLMAGDLVFAAIFADGLWGALFAKHGIEFSWEKAGWQLSRNGHQAHLDLLEVRRMIAETAFIGTSPSDAVAKVANSM